MSILVTIFIAIAYTIVAVSGVMDSRNKGIQLGLLSALVGLGTAYSTFTGPRTTTNIVWNLVMGLIVISAIAVCIYVKLSVFKNVVIIGSVFSIMFGILGYISTRLESHVLSNMMTMLSYISIAGLLLYLLVYGIMYGIKGLINFTMWKWVFLSLVLLPTMYVGFNIFNGESNRLMSGVNPFLIKIVVAELVFILFYIAIFPKISKYFNHAIADQGGRNIGDEKFHTLYEQKKISAPLKISNAGTVVPTYSYAVSFWVFINSNQQSNESYENIFSYSDGNPTVQYNPSDNLILIKTSRGNIGHIPDIKLQRWNHIVLNYINGTMDVFYNKKLLFSKVSVPPISTADRHQNQVQAQIEIGSVNKLRGNIANLLYFDDPLPIQSVNKLYELNSP